MKAALVYAQRLGWRVLPLEPRGKIPILKAWQNTASSDPEVVAGWIVHHPDSNVGVLTGDKFFVLDVDPKNGGLESLAKFEAKHGPLPRTVQARTGSGGSHYLFQMPGFPVSNSAGKLGPGLDIRGIGGQIVVAPSVTSAGPYAWINAPWDTEIAAAPDGLLAELRTKAQTPDSQQSGESPLLKSTFPPASDAVLETARQALEEHGPAVQGEGGDDHTFVAAALLVHDFALSIDEALPLFREWNADCRPPWSESDLRSKLKGGGAYGKLPYGCRRTLDAYPRVKQIIASWQSAGTGDVEALVRDVREVPCSDVTTQALIERDLTAATGLVSKKLGLPKIHAPVVLEMGQILVSTDVARVADDATKAFLPLVFARNGVLCQVVNTERLYINDLERSGLVDLMSQTSVYVRADAKQGIITTAPPDSVAGILQARREHVGVRVLQAITTAPIFLADGSILQEDGYNAQARVYLKRSVVVTVPDAPTRGAAVAAVELFRDLLQNFKFTSDADFSSWLAALLTPLVKAATDNAPAPLVCVSASSPGAGKTLLTNAIAQIITGNGAEVRPYNPRDPAEWGKRLTAFVKAASPVSVFDNCNGPIGDEGLDRLITSSTWSDRILGASDAPPLPNVSLWLATGNNIEPQNDTVRRVLMCRIDVLDERPQERTGFRYDLEGGYAREQRAALLSAALTILRAYHCADRPSQMLASWGSFTTWSALVRGALVWAGCADPFLTQQRASLELNEPETEAHDFWLSVVSGSDGTTSGITRLANERQASEVLGLRDSVSGHALRKFLNRFVDKPREGRRLRRVRHGDTARYVVERIG